MADQSVGPRVLVDRYELREQVGVGGMGEVWTGWDRRLQREVAVKLLLPQLSEEPAFRQRFETEARAAAALDHPNIVQVFDIDQDDGTLFIVMERLPGPSLDRRLAEGPLTEEEVRRVAADLLAGLAAAHEANVIHRDIKPGNLIRATGGRWKVGDFGVAKDLSSAAQLTLVGVAVGTPAYLAPEQLDGRPATPATDLWAAAVVLREALTGSRPFDGNDPISIAHAIQHTRVPPLASIRPDVDPALATAIDRGLAFDPRHRFASAAQMIDAIEGRPVPPPEAVSPPPPAVATVPVAGPSGPPPAAAPPVAAPPIAAPPAGSRTPSAGRMVAVAAVVAGLIVAVFLLSLLLGLVMRDHDDGDDGGAADPTEETGDTGDPPQPGNPGETGDTAATTEDQPATTGSQPDAADPPDPDDDPDGGSNAGPDAAEPDEDPDGSGGTTTPATDALQRGEELLPGAGPTVPADGSDGN